MYALLNIHNNTIFFCDRYLLPERGRHAKQKTPVMKKNCNPQFNHTFVFEDVAWEDLRDRCLELTIWDHDRFTSNDFLGGVRLNVGSGKWDLNCFTCNDSLGYVHLNLGLGKWNCDCFASSDSDSSQLRSGKWNHGHFTS